MTDIPLRWVGTDATGAAASSVKKNIDSVGKAATGAQGGVKGLTSAMSSMAPAGKQAQGALSGMESAAKNLLGGLGGVAAAMGVGAVVGFGGMMVGAAMEMGKAAEASDRLRTSFDGLAQKAGASSAEIINTLQQASGGAIAEYDLMLAANKAMILGVASSADEMGKLMEIARTRGSAMGLSATQAFNDLVTGLGRGSALILDNLGIVVDAEATNEAYAESIGKTVAQLSEQEKKQALVNATLKEATGQAMPAASAYERMGAAMADMKVELGDLFGPAISAAAEAIAAGIQSVNESLNAPAPTIVDGLVAQYAALEAQRDALLRQGDYEAAQTANNTAAQQKAIDAQHDYALEALLAMNAVNEAQQADLSLYSVQMAEVKALTEAQRVYNDARARGLNDAQAQAAVVQAELDRLSQQMATGLYRGGERNPAIGNAAQAAQAKADADFAAAMAAAFAKQEAAAAAYNARQADMLASARDFQGALVEVAGAIDAGNLSVSQGNAILGQMAAQYGVLTAAGMTSAGALYSEADARQQVTEAAMAQIDAAIASATAAGETRAAIETLHGAQMAAGESARGLGIELNFVGDAGFGAKGGIDAASYSAVSAQGSFWGLVDAAAAASEAMRQAQIDSSANRIEGAFLGAVGTLGADKTYEQYQSANAGLELFAHGLEAAGVPLDRQKFLLEEYNTRVSDAIEKQVNAANVQRDNIAAHEMAGRRAAGLGVAAGGATGKLGDLAGKAGDLAGKFQGILDKIPGLKGTSEVSEKQMEDAKLGIPQNFADDYLRRLTDEVLNGVDWAGVDIGDAAQRAGIDPSLPAQTILAMFKNAWADSSLFANPANLDLINMDAVKAGLTQANNAASGKANIDALFGIGDDATIAAVASLGLKVQSGLGEWLSENGAPDAGAKLAAALGSGVSTAGIPLDGGLQTWQNSDAAKAAADSVGTWLGSAISERTIIRPTVQMPEVPASATPPPSGGGAPTPAFASGTTYFGGGWAKVHKDEVVRLASGPVYNARQSNKFAEATVVVNAVINNKLDEAQFAQMLRSAMRRAQVRS
jgi:hypothetical protein